MDTATQKVRLELLQENRLIGSHVFQRGDVFELDEVVAKDWTDRGHARISTKPLTAVPVSGPRHLKIREREQAALAGGRSAVLAIA